jgi:hypothetical protein
MTIFLFFITLMLSCMVFAQDSDVAIRGVVPFELKEHCIIVKGKINGSPRQYDFIVDTGGLTFIDKEIAQEFGLKMRGNMAKIDTLEIGDITIPNIFAFMTFDSESFKKHGITFHGIIGSNLLERFRVILDYQNQKMVISSTDEIIREITPVYRCKFTNHPINNAPMVNCIINGTTSVKAMVDTGQPYSIVFPLDYLDKLNAGSSQLLVESKGIMIKWPGTSKIESYLWRLDQFEMGDLKINDLMCCFAELPRPLSVPLLGKDYLCQFLVAIDYPNDEILFMPYENARFVENRFSFGINLGRGENNTIVVEGLWTGGAAHRAGIEVGDEIVECNSMSISGDDVFKIRQLLNDENLKNIELIVKNMQGQRELILNKEMLLNSGNLHFF